MAWEICWLELLGAIFTTEMAPGTRDPGPKNTHPVGLPHLESSIYTECIYIYTRFLFCNCYININILYTILYMLVNSCRACILQT